VNGRTITAGYAFVAALLAAGAAPAGTALFAVIAGGALYVLVRLGAALIGGAR